MKKIDFLIVFLCVITWNLCYAQDKEQKASIESPICLTAWVPEQIDYIPIAARQSLLNKLTKVISDNGLAGSPYKTRFIITANVISVDKEILPGPPPMHVLNLNVTLYIGDGIEGTVFSSMEFSLKGVGTNETKAHMNALKSINGKNPEIANFIEKGKKEISDFYRKNCDFMIKEANVLADQNQFREAIYLLTSIPSVNKDCFDKAMSMVKPIYQRFIDRDCQMKLQEATGIWNAAQDMYAANEAGYVLSTIDPNSSCYSKVKTLSNKIAARVKQIDSREWKYVLNEQKQQSEWIKAVRDIGVAYGKGSKSNIYYKTLW